MHWLPTQAHAEFRRVMREKGVRVLTVREILAFGTADHVGARLELEEFAMQVRCPGWPSGYETGQAGGVLASRQRCGLVACWVSWRLAPCGRQGRQAAAVHGGRT